MRIGEACALRVSDVDLEREEISVRESKTDSGIRRVPIVPELHVELQAWFGYLKREGRYLPTGPLLATRNRDADGMPTAMKAQFAWRIVKRVANRAGVRPKGEQSSSISPHTLRRTFGSDLLNRGVRLESVSKLLGHADTRVTEACYAELLDETIRVEVRRALAS